MTIGSPDFCFGAISLLVALGIWRLITHRRTAVSTHNDIVRLERKPGKWSPVGFRYPDFEPYPNFDVHTTKAIRYRPFRWGKFPINMGIRTMPWDSWIEIDNEYLKLLKIRKARIADRGKKVFQTLPGAERAALEACTELAAFLAKRYPRVFRVHRVHDRGGLGSGDSIGGPDGGRIKIVEILPTGDRWDLDVDDPMMVGGLLADDIAVMVEGSDGLYTLRAGSICIPGSWRLVDKIGLNLEDIHVKGRVPQYKEKLQMSMDRFFKNMTVDKAVARNNYTLQVDPDISWANKLHGDEDLFDQGTKGAREGTGVGPRQQPDPNCDMSEIYFRTERQTLRRLPQTGCVCFTIRTYFYPVTEIVSEANVPGRLAAAIRSWPEAVLHRKGMALYQDNMLPWLDGLHRHQIEEGLIDAEDKTSHYPF